MRMAGAPTVAVATAAGETIFALSSGRLPAAIAVVRVSGPAVRALLAAVAGCIPEPRHAVLRELRDPGDGGAIDRGLVLFFPGPASATGEDVAEFHVHGGRAVVRALAEVLRRLGARPAEAGEFSRRGYVNGIFDITQAEGIADLVAAETERQRRQAFAQAGGELGARYREWRSRLIRLRALVEAELDFVEEEDVAGAAGEVNRLLAGFVGELQGYLDAGSGGERLRDGLEVVLTGRPNVGKSSLINALAGRDVAIVTPEPGTTRDLVELRLDLGGVPVQVVDTAGVREVEGLAEREGIRRGAARAAAADLVIEVDDLTAPCRDPASRSDGRWRVGNKRDLIDSETEQSLIRHYDYVVSAADGRGIGAFVAALTDWAQGQVGPTENIVITRARHRAGLEAAVGHMRVALAPGLEGELVAEELRLAADAIGRVTGHIDVEDVLDSIFGEFCIGK